MKLIIGDLNYSTWSMRPWLFVHKHGLPVEVESHELSTRQMSQVLSKRFSNGKVPVLVDDPTEVWDSLAILEYLGECFPDTRPWPDDVRARAVARSVSAEMHSSFTALRDQAPMNLRRRFPGYRISEAAHSDVARIRSLWQYCQKRFANDGSWLFGQFTIGRHVRPGGHAISQCGGRLGCPCNGLLPHCEPGSFRPRVDSTGS